MKLFAKAKDGGPESHTTGYWLIEAKGLFSIALLRFEDGTREAYHTHAFNAISWLLRGKLVEYFYQYDRFPKTYLPGWKPICTPRNTFHKVSSVGTSWAITFRGPWRSEWEEYIPETDEHLELTHGRKVIGRY